MGVLLFELFKIGDLGSLELRMSKFMVILKR